MAIKKYYINDNGVKRLMTPEEVADKLSHHADADMLFPEERISKLEAQLAALTAGYREGVNQA